MTRIVEGTVVDAPAEPLLVRLRRGGVTLGEHRATAPFTVEPTDGGRLQIDASDAEVFGAARETGTWGAIKAHPHAALVKRRAPGPHVEVALEVAALAAGEVVFVAVDAIDESLPSAGYRGADEPVRSARAVAIGLGSASRSELEERFRPPAAEPEAREAPSTRPNPRAWSVRRFYLGYAAACAAGVIAALTLGGLPALFGAWAALYFAVLAAIDLCAVHFPLRFRVGKDGGTFTRNSFWFRRSQWRPGEVGPWMLPWRSTSYVVAYTVAQVLLLPAALGVAHLLGMTETSERPLLWIEGMITLGLGVTLLARARRLLWWSALVLRAPIARSGTALDFGALEGIARAATPVRRLESAFHLRWAQQHGGTQASYLTVEHRYARAPTFEVELADGTRAPVVDADGALWATGARTLVDEGGNRTLTESIDDGAPLLVVGPFTGAGIEGAGPESVLLVGARSGSSARASLVRACVAAVLPGAAVIVLGVLVALASLAT